MLSVVIPTLNEEADLPETIRQLKMCAGLSKWELIISDCNSRDETVSLSRSMGAIVVEGATSRAEALNAGATVSRGDIFLFIHADSQPPNGFINLIEKALHHSEVVGGAFDFRFASHPLRKGLRRQKLKIVMICNRIRFRWSGNFYGDQGIFVRKTVFNRIGGFPIGGLMEDMRFSRRMKNLGKTAIVSPPMKTSPRRFLARGVFRQFAFDLVLIACENLGFSPTSLWNQYNQLNSKLKVD